MTEKIRHILIIWDECEHLSRKKVNEIGSVFFKHYVAAFPHGAKTPESPMIIPTSSPILKDEIDFFYHEGEFIPYTGENKDLALVKYCSTGFLDDKGIFRFFPDHIRDMRHQRGDPPMLANSSVLTVFITSDWAQGMTNSLSYVHDQVSAIRGNFVSLRIPKKINGDRKARVSYAANAIGFELNNTFVKLENDFLYLNLTN